MYLLTCIYFKLAIMVCVYGLTYHSLMFYYEMKGEKKNGIYTKV